MEVGASSRSLWLARVFERFDRTVCNEVVNAYLFLVLAGTCKIVGQDPGNSDESCIGWLAADRMHIAYLHRFELDLSTLMT
jgi:hypothetical protein